MLWKRFRIEIVPATESLPPITEAALDSPGILGYQDRTNYQLCIFGHRISPFRLSNLFRKAHISVRIGERYLAFRSAPLRWISRKLGMWFHRFSFSAFTTLCRYGVIKIPSYCLADYTVPVVDVPAVGLGYAVCH